MIFLMRLLFGLVGSVMGGAALLSFAYFYEEPGNMKIIAPLGIVVVGVLLLIVIDRFTPKKY